ncbi:hypothetical protein TBLA_0A06690 [Henningerozyma blattae CBS 6284]|uniref:HIG1 domain-containing protein n=1 Tax=Henningerozyma blattae (strain ATCC 34711 / CBS 6284 / DSM 70876 / NBRC 10599 / NRRL Y-10934 / UCD 77-7) TaxID=1071380 RepID=I2GWF9_HENB6|nr:hypothetical protein TBLA_0A06690 [Tetrapisispora blattae CBS 6284]CCH58461.1 hypothetical protein TBLA_0A06690 [Tetrapisispora blattae CBS 6284]
MKLLTSEEIEENKRQTLIGGLQGCVGGLVISGLLFRLMPRRYPWFNPKKMPWSLKTAIFIMPPTALMAICAEEASNRFDEEKYSGKQLERINEVKNEVKGQNSAMVNILDTLSKHQYKIITGLWAGSLWASWVVINRDKIMTKAQKIVQARMYAQFVTIGLLLGGLGLSMYEEKLHPNKHKAMEQRRWEEVLKEAEEKSEREKEGVASPVYVPTEDRMSSKIYKYK